MRDMLAERASIKKQQHLAELERLRKMSVEQGDMRAAVKAEELRGRALGFYVEKMEEIDPSDIRNLSDEELERRIAADEAFLKAFDAAKAQGKKKKGTKATRV